MTTTGIGSGKLIYNVAAKGIRLGFIRLGNTAVQPDTTDCYIGMSDGAPSGAYDLPTGAAALMLRSDPAGSDSVAYVTHDGGTTWTALTNTAFDPQDTEALTFGTGDDISIAWDGTRLNVTQATANSEIRWGVDGAGLDQTWYGDTASGYMRFDQSADSLIFTDGYKAVFGTGSDIAMTWDGTKLAVTQAAPNSAIELGVDGAGIDLVLYGDTASAACTWDQSADSMILTGAAKLKFQAIADPGDAGAIPVTAAGLVALTSAGAETRTLAAPTYPGQFLDIICDTYVGDIVVTASAAVNQTGNNTLTFGAAADYIRLVAVTVGGTYRWQVAANDGVALSTV